MEKRTWKFTLRDALIVALLLIVGILFIQKLSIARELDRPYSTFEIVLRSEVKEAFLLDKIQVGDQVYQKGSQSVFGTVTAVTSEPGTMDNKDIVNGVYIAEQTTPGYYNIVITIESTAFSSLNGTPIIDNNFITLNQYLVINTNRIFLPTRVMSIVTKG